MSTFRRIFAIDPSLGNLGYAALTVNGPADITLDAAGIIQQVSSRDIVYHARGLWMAHHLLGTLEAYISDHEMALDVSGLDCDVIMEVPANWFTDRGQASKDDEAVQKLYYQVGCLISILSTSEKVRGIWVATPNQWKGTTPKAVMVERAYTFSRSLMVNMREGVPHDTCEAILLARFGAKLMEDMDGPSHGYQEPLALVFARGALGLRGTFNQESFVDRGDESSSSGPHEA